MQALASKHYPDIKEFQINALIIKSSELLVHAVLAKINFFNAIPRALCFSWKKAVVNHIRVDEKLLEQGWYFTTSTAVFGNVINSSDSSKCSARNVFRFKGQVNKNKLLARAFSIYFMQCGCRKVKRLWVKDTHTMWNIFKMVVQHYYCWKYSK